YWGFSLTSASLGNALQEPAIIKREESSMNGERLIPLAQIPSKVEWLPEERRGGGKLNIATLFRWAQHGIRGVRLKIVSVGRQKCSTEVWLRDFFEALAAASDTPAPPAPRSPGTRSRAAQRAGRVLEEAGI